MNVWARLFFVQLLAIAIATYLAATNQLQLAILREPGVDKLGHFLLYGSLAFFAIGFFGRPRRTALCLASLASIEELSQALFPARRCDPLDLLATVAGILLCAALASALGLTKNKRLFFSKDRGEGTSEQRSHPGSVGAGLFARRLRRSVAPAAPR
jgi:VanZ family protein